MARDTLDKQRLRERNAAKPFAEKVRILEKLRERDQAIRAEKMAGRKGAAAAEHRINGVRPH